MMYRNAFPEPSVGEVVGNLIDQYRPGYALGEMIEDNNDCNVFALQTTSGEETTSVAWCIQPGGFYEPTEVTPGTGFSFTLDVLAGRGLAIVKRAGTEEPQVVQLGRTVNGVVGIQTTLQVRAGDTFCFFRPSEQADNSPWIMFDRGNMPFVDSYERPVGRTEPTNRLASAIITFSKVELQEEN